MGFDTYLDIGARTAVSWRKQSNSLPRMLFQHDDALIRTVENSTDEDSGLIVELRATAERVLSTLDANGLGWEATVAAYERLRQGFVTEALLTGWEIGSASHAKGILEAPGDIRTFDDIAAEAKANVSAMGMCSPREDLDALASLLAAQWEDPGTKEVLFFEEIGSDGPFTMSSSLISDAIETAKSMDLNPFSVGRAIETLGVLYRDAPLLLWPMLLSVLLRGLSPSVEVVYVLTEEASMNDLRYVEEGKAFVERYWEASADGLASYAESLGLLFGALAAFDSKLGRQFWFGRAASLLATLEALATNNDAVSTKARGDALESLFDALLRTEEPELQLVAKNFRTREEEIDLILSNGLTHPFWLAQSSPIILVECKNWKSRVGVESLRVFESKMEDRAAAAKIGIFVSMSGYTKPFLERLKQIQGKGVGIIYALDGGDLRTIIRHKKRLTDWLREEGVLRAFGQ